MINQKEIRRLGELLRKAGISADLTKIQAQIKLKQETIKNIEQRLGRNERVLVFVGKSGEVSSWNLETYNQKKQQLLSVRINPNPGLKV